MTELAATGMAMQAPGLSFGSRDSRPLCVPVSAGYGVWEAATTVRSFVTDRTPGSRRTSAEASRLARSESTSPLSVTLPASSTPSEMPLRAAVRLDNWASSVKRALSEVPTFELARLGNENAIF